jgi:hypothetical protein
MGAALAELNFAFEQANPGGAELPSRSVEDLIVSLSVAKIGAFRTVLGRHLTQGSLK